MENMSDVSARYERLADTVTARIEAVPDDRWSSASPCPEWSARDLVQHLVDSHGMFAGFIGLEPGTGPAAADDPKGAWRAASSQMRSWLDDPSVASREFEGVGGTSTFEAAVNRFICFDLLVHGWDLARATGQDATIDADEIPTLWEDVKSFGSMLRSQGAFGADLEPPTDATEQERLLAFLGRDPRA